MNSVDRNISSLFLTDEKHLKMLNSMINLISIYQDQDRWKNIE